ncbi:MAG TPA: hypothetical protein VE130_04175 [Nitrososphaeraceae archaeon]|jgi:hypothetical protein|nr:hypothetical protein [Nitrososphaeraceae archaeon]
MKYKLAKDTKRVRTQASRLLILGRDSLISMRARNDTTKKPPLPPFQAYANVEGYRR